MRIIAMPTHEAEAIRTRHDDGYGNVARLVVDEVGGSPCRHCLRRTTPGERVLLYSYRPFGHASPYQEVGPIFVHADACERYDETAGVPSEFDDRTIIMRAYDAKDDIYDSQRYVHAGDAQAAASAMFADPAVAYIHVRSYTRGCYSFRIDRDAQ